MKAARRRIVLNCSRTRASAACNQNSVIPFGSFHLQNPTSLSTTALPPSKSTPPTQSLNQPNRLLKSSALSHTPLLSFPTSFGGLSIDVDRRTSRDSLTLLRHSLLHQQRRSHDDHRNERPRWKQNAYERQSEYYVALAA